MVLKKIWGVSHPWLLGFLFHTMLNYGEYNTNYGKKSIFSWPLSTISLCLLQLIIYLINRKELKHVFENKSKHEIYKKFSNEFCCKNMVYLKETGIDWWKFFTYPFFHMYFDELINNIAFQIVLLRPLELTFGSQLIVTLFSIASGIGGLVFYLMDAKMIHDSTAVTNFFVSFYVVMVCTMVNKDGLELTYFEIFAFSVTILCYVAVLLINWLYLKSWNDKGNTACLICGAAVGYFLYLFTPRMEQQDEAWHTSIFCFGLLYIIAKFKDDIEEIFDRRYAIEETLTWLLALIYFLTLFYFISVN